MQLKIFRITKNTFLINILVFTILSNALSVNVINKFPQDSYVSKISPGRYEQVNKITLSFVMNKTNSINQSAYLDIDILAGRISFLFIKIEIISPSEKMIMTQINPVNETNTTLQVSSLDNTFDVILTFNAPYQEKIDLSASLYYLSTDLSSKIYLIQNLTSSVEILAPPVKDATVNIVNISNMNGDFIFNILLDKATVQGDGIKITFPRLNQNMEGVTIDNQISLFPDNTDMLGLVQYNGQDKRTVLRVNKQENYIFVSPMVQVNGYLSFKITNLLLPISSKSISLYLELGKYDPVKNEFFIKESSDYIPFSSSHNQPIMNFTVNPITKVAGETTNYLISFSLAYFLPQNACIYIQFPTFSSVSYDLKSITSVEFNSKSLYYEVQSNVLIIYFQNAYLDLSNQTDAKNNKINFTIKNLNNPLTTNESIDYFKSGIFYFDRLNTYNEVYTLYDQVNIKLTNSSFYSINVIASSLLVSDVNVTYDIYIKVSMLTPKDSFIQIQLPNELLLNSKTTANEIGILNIPCEISRLSKTVTIQTNVALKSKDQLIIRTSNIQNFRDTRISSPFVIKSYDPNSNLLESNNSDAKVKFTSGISLISSIKMSNDICSSPTELTVEMTFQSQLVSSSRIRLTLPHELGFTDELVQNNIELLLYDRVSEINSENSNIIYSQGNLRSIQPTYIVSIQTQGELAIKTIVIAFNSDSVITSQSYFVLKINKGIKNPRSFKETSFFTLVSTSSDGYLIDEYRSNDSFNTTLINYIENTVINKTTATLPIFKITSNNYITGYQESDLVYTIALSSSISLYSYDNLKLILPNEIKFNQITASTKDGKLITVITGQTDDKNHILLSNLPSYIANYNDYSSMLTEDKYFPDEIIYINIYGLKNPISLLETEIFSIQLISHDGFLIARNLTKEENPNNQTSIVMKQISVMSYTKLSYFEKNDNDKLMLFEISLNNYSRIIDTINNSSDKVTIDIIIPDEFTITSSIECFNFESLNTQLTKEKYSDCSNSSNTISINLTSKLFNGDINSTDNIYPIFILVKNLIPKDNILSTNLLQTSSFEISLYLEHNNSRFLIEQDNSLKFTFQCKETCSSCDLNSNICLSCFKTSDFKYLYKGICGPTCPKGTSLNESSYICENCDSKCSECKTNSIKNCTSCANIHEFLIEDQGICVTQCPDGFYGQYDILSNKNKCYPCTQPCVKCQSKDTCIECSGELFTYNDNCISSCPEGTFLSVDENNKKTCSKCHTNCLTCSNNSQHCTSCNKNLIIYDNRCLLICPAGMTNNGTSCINCPSGCAECSAIVDNIVCQVCKSAYYLNSSLQCSLKDTVCEKGSYLNKTTFKCTPCSVACSDCSDGNTCNICYDNSYLQYNKCVSSCEGGFYSDSTNKICIPCSGSNCLLCSGKNTCSACREGFILYNGECLSQCPFGTYYGPNSTSLGSINTPTSSNTIKNCYSCPDTCAKCYITDLYIKCTQCRESFFLTSNQMCQSSCPQGSIQNTFTNTCDVQKVQLEYKYRNEFSMPIDYLALLLLSVLSLIMTSILKSTKTKYSFLRISIIAHSVIIFIGNILLLIVIYNLNIQFLFIIISSLVIYRFGINLTYNIIDNHHIQKDTEYYRSLKNSKIFSLESIIRLCFTIVDYKISNIYLIDFSQVGFYSIKFNSLSGLKKVLMIFSIVEFFIYDIFIFIAGGMFVFKYYSVFYSACFFIVEYMLIYFILVLLKLLNLAFKEAKLRNFHSQNTLPENQINNSNKVVNSNKLQVDNDSLQDNSNSNKEINTGPKSNLEQQQEKNNDVSLYRSEMNKKNVSFEKNEIDEVSKSSQTKRIGKRSSLINSNKGESGEVIKMDNIQLE